MQSVKKSIVCLIACVLCCGILTGCVAFVGTTPDDSTGDTGAKDSVTLSPNTDASLTDTTVPTDSDTEESTSVGDITANDTTTAEELTVEVPEYLNPLTGLASETDLSGKRPAAIMINNIPISCPQLGISAADVIYECLVEGGYTRLMMLSMDYENLPTVGSIRSSRDYYLNIAADYDAIYIHMGGSPYAYTVIDDYGIDSLECVRPGTYDLTFMFWQDPDRLYSMGYEHSWVTDGENIVAGIKYRRYETALAEDHAFPLAFTEWGTTVLYDDTAEHIHIPFSHMQVTDFVYDSETETYLRYQNDGQKHIDGATGTQLSFENVIIYFCKTGAISGDTKDRIEVGTVGEGSGYYATKGTYIPIRWVKDSYESPTRFYTEDGEELLLNAGKTFISVCPTSIVNTIEFNYTT